MSRYQEFNRLLYGEIVGWLNGKPILKALTSEEYETLLSLLFHEKVRLRWSAAVQLGKIGDERAVESLIKALQDSHWLVRLHAVKALGCIKSQVSIVPLTGLITDNCSYVRRRVVISIRQLSVHKDDYLIELLISALNDSDKIVRARAAWVLGDFISPTAIRAIASAVSDKDSNVSWSAIGALQKTGTTAVPSLINLLASQESEVRYRAIKVLGKIRDFRAIQPLERMLNDPSEKVRQRAEYALHQIKYPFARYFSIQKNKSMIENVRNFWRKLWKRT